MISGSQGNSPNKDQGGENGEVLETFYLPEKDKKGGLHEFITVMVFPCGKEDGSHLTPENKKEKPYLIKI
jgi:hypothetical protein